MRHWVSVATVTPYLRLLDSKSAPQSSSRATLSLRLADHRPLPVRANSASRVSRPTVLGADPESGLVLYLQRLLAANQCPPKSWGGGDGRRRTSPGCMKKGQRADRGGVLTAERLKFLEIRC
jgi:hypothetical protein